MDDVEQLRETFAAHEHLTPNAIEVLRQANVRARSYRRRRRVAQATGASVLGAGVVVGSVALPGLKLHTASRSGTSTAAGSSGVSLPGPSAPASAIGSAVASSDPSAPPSPSISPSPSPTYTQEQELAEYFADGFDYNDAMSLGALWNETDVLQIKVEAGQKLLAGQTLPITPSVSTTAPTPSANLSLGPGVPNTAESKAEAAYFAAGYTYNDAVSLGKLWNETDILTIKVEAGQKILTGQTLPIKP